MKKDTIAVLLASYNGSRYIMEQMESLRAQTCRDFVCYIHDDGSTDGTQDIISTYCCRYPDHFVYLGSGRTGGSKYNFFYMLSRIEADYIMFCDQDDVWLPEKIEKTRQAMHQAETDAGQTPVCVFSDLRVVDMDLNVMSESFFAYAGLNPYKTSLVELLYDNVAPGCTMMINRPLRDLALAAEVTDRIYMHDWHLMLLAAAAGRIVLVDEPLILYRQHGDNTFGAQKGSRNYFYKMRHLLELRRWLKLQRENFAVQQSNAQALLLCLEAAVNTVQPARLDESIQTVRTFVRQMDEPLLIRIVRCYRIRWGKAKGS